MYYHEPERKTVKDHEFLATEARERVVRCHDVGTHLPTAP